MINSAFIYNYNLYMQQNTTQAKNTSNAKDKTSFQAQVKEATNRAEKKNTRMRWKIINAAIRSVLLRWTDR